MGAVFGKGKNKTRKERGGELRASGSAGSAASAASASSRPSTDGSSPPKSSSSTPSNSLTSDPQVKWDEEVMFNPTNKKVCVDDFDIISVIGKGSFGKVMLVRKKDDGEFYAMKVLRKEAIIARKQVAHTMAERAILQKIKHPFIVQLHYAFQTDDKLYMVLDYVNGGEVFFHLKKEGKFTENRVRVYAAEIVMALQHMHDHGVVYRDLKPENILLDRDGHIRITDFGLSKEVAPEQGTHTFCGTPEYLAPEVLKAQGHSHAVDWWSLGTLVYEMLTGLPPFYSQNINIMYQKILNGELRFPSYVSPEAVSLLEGLLTRDPEKRLGMPNADGIKAHAFFKGLDWDKLYAREIPAPFKPKVASDVSTEQIDPAFTSELAVDSVVENSTLANTKEGHFDNFTFIGSSAIAAGGAGGDQLDQH